MDLFYLFDTEHKEEAWKWMAFTQKNRYQAPITKLLGFVPTRKSLAAEKLFQEDPLFATFAAKTPYAKFTPILPEWIQIQDILGIAIQRVLLGDLSPREALDEAAEEADAVLADE